MTAKNFALLLPNWDSLDSVRNAHSHLELWAIWLFAVLVVCDVAAHFIEDDRKALAKRIEKFGFLFFALAVVCELGAYKYGQRNDELSGSQIESLDALAKEAKTTAGEAKTTAGEAETKADAADTAAGKAQKEANTAKAASDRALQDAAELHTELNKAKADAEAAEAQQREISEVLSTQNEFELRHPNGPHLRMYKNDLPGSLKTVPPAEARIEYEKGTDEAQAFAGLISHALKNAGWSVSGPIPVGQNSENTKGLSLPGVRIFNKDISFGLITGWPEVRPDGTRYEDPWSMIEVVRAKGNLSSDVATRLVVLGMDLGADLVKDEKLKEGSVRIFVSGP
jgi:hypothetical protein